MSVKTTTDTQTDWNRLARQDDNEINYSDTPSLSQPRKDLKIRQPNDPTIFIKETNIEIDEEILAWFKSHKSNYKESINQLLRDYIAKNELIR